MNATMKMLVVVSALGGVAARADEQDESRVPETDVPKVVLEAVTRKFPTATARSFATQMKAAGLQYEAEVEVRENGKTRKLSVEVSPRGTILFEEEVIVFDELPSVVKNAHQASRYGKATVEVVEREVKDQKMTFELLVATAEGKRELVYDARGTLLKEKVKGRQGRR